MPWYRKEQKNPLLQDIVSVRALVFYFIISHGECGNCAPEFAQCGFWIGQLSHPKESRLGVATVQRLALGRLQAISRIVVSDARDRLEGVNWSILGVWPLAISASIPSENYDVCHESSGA